MKKLGLTILSCILGFSVYADAFQAVYVVKNNGFAKYNFGVAEDMVFSENGTKLTIKGYNDIIDLNAIDYITFEMPFLEGSLTPNEQKEKMLAIGQEAADKIDLNLNDELLRMQNVFFESDNDAFGNWHQAYVDYDFPEEFTKIRGHKSDNVLATTIRAMAEAAQGNAAAVRSLKSRAVDLYRASDYYGIYTANDETETWDKTAEAKHLELRFADFKNSGVYSIKVTCSDDYTTWDTPDFVLQMPKTIVITFSKDASQLASATLTTAIVSEKSINMDADVTLNGYKILNSLKINNSEINDNVEVLLANGEKFITGNTTIKGKNLMVYDEMYEAIQESMHYHDEEGNCVGEDPEMLISHFYRAEANVDVLNTLQIKTKANGFQKIYKDLSVDSYVGSLSTDEYSINHSGKIVNREGNNSIITVCYEDESIVEMWANTLNNYVDATFYYDGKPQAQGFIGMEIVPDDNGWNPWYDETYDTHAYTELNGFLLQVYRNIITENGNNIVYSNWYYNKYNYTNYEWEEIPVAEDKVFKPTTIIIKDSSLTPTLIFPDRTSFIIEDFFDEDSFSKLINDYEDIIDTYYSIIGDDKEDFIIGPAAQ